METRFQDAPNPVANPERRENRPVPAAWWVLLWTATLALVGCLVWDNAQSMSAVDPAARFADPAQISSVQLELISRYTVGVGAASVPLPQSQADQAYDDLSGFALGPVEHIRIAMVFAAEGMPERGLSALIEAEMGIEEALAAPDPYAAEAAVWAEQLRADADVVRSLILTPGTDIDPAALDALDRRHAWFALAARAAAESPAGPATDAYQSSTRRSFFVALGFGTTVIVAFIVGVELAIVALVLSAKGKIRSGLNLTRLGTGTHRAAAFEGFVLFLGGFVAVRIALELLAYSGAITSAPVFAAIQFVMLWSLLLVVVWPVLRGSTWREARAIAGWGLAQPGGIVGALRETVLGLVGYIAGLPVMALGLLLSLLLIAVSGAEPTHPAVDGIRAGGTLGVVMTVILATVWAPVVEETVFRGMLYAGLRGPRVAACLPAALLSGFFFAVIHPQGFALVPALASIGVVFALIREWRGSTLGCIVGHALHNGALFALLILAGG